MFAAVQDLLFDMRNVEDPAALDFEPRTARNARRCVLRLSVACLRVVSSCVRCVVCARLQTYLQPRTSHITMDIYRDFAAAHFEGLLLKLAQERTLASKEKPAPAGRSRYSTWARRWRE